jgi:hypothetical protein
MSQVRGCPKPVSHFSARSLEGFQIASILIGTWDSPWIVRTAKKSSVKDEVAERLSSFRI